MHAASWLLFVSFPLLFSGEKIPSRQYFHGFFSFFNLEKSLLDLLPIVEYFKNGYHTKYFVEFGWLYWAER